MDIIISLILFVGVFAIYLFLFNKKIKKENYKNITEAEFLITRHDLDRKKIEYRKLVFDISLINGFIITIVYTIIININLNLILQLLIGFILLFLLIYSIYEIYGRYLKKKWGNKK